jgi:RecA-family ATPase
MGDRRGVLKLDITELVDRVCAVLGVTPADVRSVNLTPAEVVVVTYRLREDGAKYVGDDGEAAVLTHRFEAVYSRSLP